MAEQTIKYITTPLTDETVTVMTYGEEEGDYHAEHIRIGDGEILFDFVSP